MDQTPITIDDKAIEMMGGMPSVESVRELESHLLGFSQVDLSTEHVVFGGMCARTIFIPAGTVLTGALTNIDNTCVISGDITVTTDEGPQRLTGVHIIPAAAGSKRAGVAHADTWWTTIHVTDLTDIQAIEDEMTDESASLGSRMMAIRAGSGDCVQVGVASVTTPEPVDHIDNGVTQ